MATQVRDAPAEHVVELPEPWRSATVTVVLPTYNEAANLPAIAAELLGLPLSGLRILVADDNSPDGTGRIADELAARYGPDRMTVVHRPGKQGLGRAYVDGMTRAIARARSSWCRWTVTCRTRRCTCRSCSAPCCPPTLTW